MANPNGRPKGPPKRRLLITILEPAYEWLEEKAAARNQKPAAYLARNVEQQAENAAKSDRTREVSPNFKGGKK